MTFSLSIPLIVGAAGGIVYLASAGKISEIGRLTFFAGILATLLHLR